MSSFTELETAQERLNQAERVHQRLLGEYSAMEQQYYNGLHVDQWKMLTLSQRAFQAKAQLDQATIYCREAEARLYGRNRVTVVNKSDIEKSARMKSTGWAGVVEIHPVIGRPAAEDLHAFALQRYNLELVIP